MNTTQIFYFLLLVALDVCLSAMPGKVDLKGMYIKITDGEGGGGHDMAKCQVVLCRSVAIGILLCFEHGTYFRFRSVQQN
jgi:hypothetical protein